MLNIPKELEVQSGEIGYDFMFASGTSPIIANNCYVKLNSDF